MVDIYFEKELSDIVFESDSLQEWKDLVQELNISGQADLAKGSKSPIPFPYMNNKMKLVCKTLCPASNKLQDYNKTPIPLDVLKQAKFAINENHFGEIQVWYDDKSPDPFLVGITENWYGYVNKKGHDIRVKGGLNDYFKSKQAVLEAANIMLEEDKEIIILENKIYKQEKDMYLIARWGDELKSFKELTQLAIERTIEGASMKLVAEIAKLNEKLKNIKTNAPLYIEGNVSKYELEGNW